MATCRSNFRDFGRFSRECPLFFWRTMFTLFIINNSIVFALHLKGTWNTDDFFHFLTKFGFQQTNMHDKKNTQGYIYGNVTSSSNFSTPVTLVLTDSDYFVDFFGNRTKHSRPVACKRMFHSINKISWDFQCNPKGNEDFLRRIPCQKGQLCSEEVDPREVMSGYQFTYTVQDIKQPRFWFLSLVACSRGGNYSDNCTWTYIDQSFDIQYDIWLVNGRPDLKHINPFEHQFSFDQHDVVELFGAFWLLYAVLLPLQCWTLHMQRHALPLLLTICMSLEATGVTFNLIHVLLFAWDGQGIDLLRVVGSFVDVVAQCTFMLLLLLVAKGWTITRGNLTQAHRAILIVLWSAYTLANLGLFVWNLMAIDVMVDVDEWATWPGWIILGFRLLIMVWFLTELKDTFNCERAKEKQRFYLHFGAGFLVWFVYLPIVALIGSIISALWRYKTILSVSLGADWLSYFVLTHLLWPSRSNIYFTLTMVERPLTNEQIEFADLGQGDSGSEDSDIHWDEEAKLLALSNGCVAREHNSVARQSPVSQGSISRLDNVSDNDDVIKGVNNLSQSSL